MNKKKRYVQVGVGGRARFFYEALAEKFAAYKNGLRQKIEKANAAVAAVEVEDDDNEF